MKAVINFALVSMFALVATPNMALAESGSGSGGSASTSTSQNSSTTAGQGSTDSRVKTTSQEKAAELKAELEARKAEAEGKAAEAKAKALELKDSAEKRKEDAKVKISDERSKLIKNRCGIAQENLGKVVGQWGDGVVKREGLYANIVTKATSIIAQAQTAGVDTTTLAADVATMQSMLANLKTANMAFQSSLSSLKAVDCSVDQQAYQTALETARADRSVVVGLAAELRTFVNEQIRSDFQSIKSQLEALESSILEPSPSPTPAVRQ